MSVPLASDLTKWTHPVDYQTTEWRRLASTLYINANPSFGSIFTFVEIHPAETSGDNINDVPDNRLGKCLRPVSFFAYLDYFPHFFNTSRFLHGMRISGHLTDIQMSGEPRMTYAGGWLELWLYWGGRGAAICQSKSDRTDSSFVCTREKVTYERWLSVMIAEYVR